MYKNDICINAVNIWHLLSDNGALSVKEITEMTNYHEELLFLALGWLAHENKICFFEKDGTLHAELSYVLSEMYY